MSSYYDINYLVNCLLHTFAQLKLQVMKTLAVKEADDHISKEIFPGSKHWS